MWTTTNSKTKIAICACLLILMGCAPVAKPPELVNIHRLWNGSKNWVDHLYTTSTAEAKNARDNLNFEHEGLLGKCYSGPKEGAIPLYRLYHTVNKKPDHFYTTDPLERDKAISDSNYVLEGITCYVPTKTSNEGVLQTISVYRLFNSAPDHFYTTSRDEVAKTIGEGWKYEGVGFYVYPADPCPKECTPGVGNMCNGKNIRICRENENLCTAWEEIATCNERCFDGQCLPYCDNECTQINQTTCIDGSVSKCVENSVNCRVWQLKNECSNGCRNSRCLRETCTGEVEDEDAKTYVLYIADSAGCGGTYSAFANSLSDAQTCASKSGLRVVSQLCSFVIQVEPGYETEIIAPSQSDALNCVKQNVCSNCNLEIIRQGACLQ